MATGNNNYDILKRISDGEKEVVQRAESRGYKVNVREFNPSNLTGTRVQCDPYDEPFMASEKNGMNEELIALQRHMGG